MNAAYYSAIIGYWRTGCYLATWRKLGKESSIVGKIFRLCTHAKIGSLEPNLNTHTRPSWCHSSSVRTSWKIRINTHIFHLQRVKTVLFEKVNVFQRFYTLSKKHVYWLCVGIYKWNRSSIGYVHLILLQAITWTCFTSPNQMRAHIQMCLDFRCVRQV